MITKLEIIAENPLVQLEVKNRKDWVKDETILLELALAKFAHLLQVFINPFIITIIIIHIIISIA